MKCSTDTSNNYNHNIFLVKNTTISEINCTIEIFSKGKKQYKRKFFSSR